MTSPSPTHSDSSSSSKHDGNQVSVCVSKDITVDALKAAFMVLTIPFTVCLQDSWEIVEGLRGVSANMQEPDRQEGFLLKRRKWPMKGWHKVSPSEIPLTSLQ